MLPTEKDNKVNVKIGKKKNRKLGLFLKSNLYFKRFLREKKVNNSRNIFSKKIIISNKLNPLNKIGPYKKINGLINGFKDSISRAKFPVVVNSVLNSK